MPSLHEREPGVWTIRVADGHDPVDGRRRTITTTFKGSERQARARAAELQVDHDRNQHGRTDHTLRQTLAAWRADATHTAGTARNYDLAESTIPAHLMKTPVHKIQAATIRELVKRVRDDHGVHRARLVHAVISGALTHAWRQEWTPGNAARKVKAPAQPSAKMGAPSVADVQRLLALVAERPDLLAWLTLSTVLGARRSEVLALHWSDVDMGTGEVRITKALDPVGGGEKATKTAGERTVAIGPSAVRALELWYVAFNQRAQAAGATTVRDPYVFTKSVDGSVPWRPDYATKLFRRLADEAGVKHHLHSLRHSAATQLLAAGLPLKVVGDRLGHTRLATTSDLYGSMLPASDRAAAEAMERLMTS